MVVKGFVGTPDGKHSRWVCACDCGSDLIVLTQSLRGGLTKSCGCLQRESAAKLGRSKKTHGLSGTVEYSSWQDIKRRCYDPEDANYHNYGGRGISMCEAWRDDVVQFVVDVGLRPKSGMTLDRIDTNGHYEPRNMRWASNSTQQRNRRDTVWLRMPAGWRVLADVADEFGIHHSVLKGRLRGGWYLREALTKPVGGKRSAGPRLWCGYRLKVQDHPDVRIGGVSS